eukprot:TRINITY_DN90564_c0_g1_i1.p1 TRINITY_DN90564_c0_g1~~TRINITY_DN90564_c0_g1_i1.p1  ORF type:complete len:278 (+),score=24.26 TRINITY_DN90564_c0_g1_i1:32-865(+)
MVLKGAPVSLLLGVAGADDSKRFELQKGTPIKIGRNKVCDFVIPNARGVSGFHAEIVLIDSDSPDGPTCCVKDVSQNGTMLLADGKRRIVKPEPHLTLLSNECVLMLPYKTKTGEPRLNLTVTILRENPEPEPVDRGRRGQGGVVDTAAPKPEEKKESVAPVAKKPAVDSEKIQPRAKRRAGVKKSPSVERRDAKADKSRSKSCSSEDGKNDSRRRQRSRSRSNSRRQRRNSSREHRDRRPGSHRDRRETSRDRRGGHRSDRRDSDRRGYRSDRRHR